MIAGLSSVFKRLLCLGWVAAVLAVNAAVPPDVPVTKVVRQYALTPANDFPQRDPFDWQLLASNDGGKSWKVLDARKGELFAERHQRRVFTVANPAAFNVYRLQIDRVRDPAGADSVQIAEIELLGQSEQDLGPTPLFADAISSQGANPPVEADSLAFDGRVETKWLDRANQAAATRASWIQWQYLSLTNLVITNVAQLRLLRTRAAEHFPVEINCVLVGSTRGTNQWYFLDDTGFFEASSPAAGAFASGQRVLLSGRSQWTGGRVEVGDAVVTALGKTAPTEPKKILPGELVAPEEDFRWVEVEGNIQFLTRSDNQLEFELVDQGQSMKVRVLHPAAETIKEPAVGSRVRVRGICSAGNMGNGDRVATVLWVSGMDSVVLEDKPSVSSPPRNYKEPLLVGGTNSASLIDIKQIFLLTEAELKLRPKVKVRGVVTELIGTYIQQDTAGIEVVGELFEALPTQNFGDYVEVEGTAQSALRHGRVIAGARIRSLGRGKLPEPVRPSWSQLDGGQMDARWIEVEGVVWATDGSHLLLEYDGRKMMATIRSAPAGAVRGLVDATVGLRGVCINATDERSAAQGIQLVVPSLEYVTVKEKAADMQTLPIREIGSLNRIGSSVEFNHRIRLKGVLTIQDGRKYFLEDATGGLMAVSKTDVMLKALTPRSRWVFWQTPDEEAVSEAGNLAPGDEVEVMGFAETRGFAPIVTEALIRKTGQATNRPPVKTTATDLSLGRLDSALVSLDGLVLGREMLGAHFVMQIQSEQRVFRASLRTSAGEAPKVAPGSHVNVIGVCQMEPGFHAELGKSPAAFSLLLRTPGDITILRSPPWWTPQKALMVAGALLLVLCGAVVWIRMLHRQVEDRTRLLKQEITEHEMTELRLAEETKLLQREIEEHRRTERDLAEKTGLLEREIEERKRVEAEVEKVHKKLLSASRLAGMADVATNVLHNVGNVLNSVNVLSASITTQVQRSKMPGVARLAELLGRHREQLGHFVTEDENGKHVPAHLERLGTHLEEERAGLLEKAKALNESVQHAKEIVAMQQNYAKVAGVLETVSLAELVEDALRMCTGALERHEIEIERDFEATPTVTLDRHKVLQILFNLLDNAKHACESPDCKNGKVTVRTRCAGANRVRVQVTDNGIGISAAHLERIFTQGFSTRKGGHGFGLHSSILAAQDMGGSLTVESAGPGRGATFTLEIPVTPQNVSGPVRVQPPMLR